MWFYLTVLICTRYVCLAGNPLFGDSIRGDEMICSKCVSIRKSPGTWLMEGGDTLVAGHDALWWFLGWRPWNSKLSMEGTLDSYE